jgi:DNA-binding response OmpR family regulator
VNDKLALDNLFIPRRAAFCHLSGEKCGLNVYINYLRNKIESPGTPRLIHTIRGVGYMLSDKDPHELL